MLCRMQLGVYVYSVLCQSVNGHVPLCNPAAWLQWTPAPPCGGCNYGASWGAVLGQELERCQQCDVWRGIGSIDRAPISSSPGKTKTATGGLESKHLPFCFSFCLNRRIMWQYHGKVNLSHSITKMLWYIYSHFYKVPCPKKGFPLFPSSFCVSFPTRPSVLTLSFWKYTRPCQSATHHLASIDCASCQEGSFCVRPPPNLLPARQAHYANLTTIVHFTQARQLIKQ